MTNADKIRRLNDENLARFLVRVQISAIIQHIKSVCLTFKIDPDVMEGKIAALRQHLEEDKVLVEQMLSFLKKETPPEVET